MAVEIGQLRFTSRQQCLGNSMPVEISSTQDIVTADSSFQFSDARIKLQSGHFDTTKTYYLKLDIPRDINYDMTFTVKLVQFANDGSQVYQFIKKITVPKGGTTQNVYDVVLYGRDKKDQDGNYIEKYTFAMIPEPYAGGTVPAVENVLYMDVVTNSEGLKSKRFYIGNADGTYTRTTDVNDISMIASWRSSTDILSLPFEFTFKPVIAGFDSIVIEMERTAEDYGIQRPNGGYGRELNLDYLQDSFSNYITANETASCLFEVKNLLQGLRTPLQQIGVWGHPGLLMLINSEEIKIGPSGFYELDSIPIEEVGIVARGIEDMWTLDYTYIDN